MEEVLKKIVKALLFNVLCLRNTDRYYRLRGHIAHFLVSAKLYEKDQISLINSLDLKDAVVLDVGAGFGVYSKLLSQCVGDGGKVFSFEANPVIYQEMLRLVKGKNIEPYNIALSDTNKTTTLYLPSILGSIPEPSLATLNETNECELYEVEAKALDSLDFPLENVRFIKVDIEGYDFRFLLGAKETLRKNSAIIQFEEHDVRKLFDDYSKLADELGYRVCALVDGALKDIQQANIENFRRKHSKGDNIFYLSPRDYKQ